MIIPRHAQRSASRAALFFLFVSAGLARTTSAYGQDTGTEHSTVRVGVIGGASLATVANDYGYTTNATYRLGASVGGLAVLPVTRLFSVEPEVLYVQKGSRSNAVPPESMEAADYVEVPVLARLEGRMGLGHGLAQELASRLTLFAVGGPEVSVLANCHIDDLDLPHDCNRFAFPQNHYNRVDLGAIGGAGVGIDVGRQRLSLSARYEWGMRRVAPEDPVTRRVLSYLVATEWPIH